MMPLRNQITPDINTQLKDAGAITATAAWQVGGSNKIVSPWGTTATYGEFLVTINVSAINITDNDELYRLQIQGSTSATFADTIVTLASLELGANEVLVAGVDVDSVIGNYVMYGHNDVAGTIYPYIRGYSTISGTTPSINHQAWLTALQ